MKTLNDVIKHIGAQALAVQQHSFTLRTKARNGGSADDIVRAARVQTLSDALFESYALLTCALQHCMKALNAAAAANADEAVRHGEHGRIELQAGYHGVADGLRLALSMLGQQAALYPFYCVDCRDRVDTAHQYLGPYDTHDAAFAEAPPGALVRRCRRVRASEVEGLHFDATWADSADEYLLDRIVEAIDEHVCSGNLPVGAWHNVGKQIAEATVDALPTADTFRTWLNTVIQLDAYICEGDE